MVGRRNPWMRAGLYLTLLVFAFLYIYPFLIELGTAFKTETGAVNDAVNPIPHNWVVTGFTSLTEFSSGYFPLWALNSVVVAVIVTAGRVLFDSMAGYALARLRFRGRGGVFTAILAVIMVPGVVLLIPKFLVIRTLGLYDNYGGLIIPLVADAAGVFIMKQFFESIPPSIEEAAHIDGAGTFRTFWSVVLPMARPALIALTILSFQGSWNDFADILITHQSQSLDTLPTGIGRLVSGALGAATQYPLRMAAALIMTIPVAIVFVVFQKYILRTGEGAVKE